MPLHNTASAILNLARQESARSEGGRRTIAVLGHDESPLAVRPVEVRSEGQLGGTVPLALLLGTAEGDDVDPLATQPAHAAVEVRTRRRRCR